VIGVAWSGDQTQYQRFVDKYRLSFPQALDAAGELFGHFGVPGQPAWVFVDRNGKATRHLGALGSGELTKTFDRLLAG
jgi:peroxiredoxin